MDEEVRRWRQTGTIYFWFESDRKQGDGWHLAADKAGCQDLESIIDLASSARFPSRFHFAVSRLSSPTGKAVAALTLSHDRSWPENHWSLSHSDRGVTCEFGSEGLDKLRAVVGDLRQGRGDYMFGGDTDDQNIWVWWPPK